MGPEKINVTNKSVFSIYCLLYPYVEISLLPPVQVLLLKK